MVRLRVLGSIDLRTSDGRELRAVLAQPKRFALLAYLAAHAGSYCQRDSLLGLFWPELDETHARSALSQALRFLRKELAFASNATLIGRHANEIGINPAVLWSDLAEFRSSLADGKHAEALELYRGELLSGFFADTSQAFEDWLSRERARLQADAARAARALAALREREQSLTDAVAAARRAVDLAPVDERVLRELLELLDRSGDRAGAIRAFEDFSRRLAVEYDTEPSAETGAVIARIRGTEPSTSRAVAHARSDTRQINVAMAMAPRSRSDMPNMFRANVDARTGDAILSDANGESKIAPRERFSLRWLAGAGALGVVITALQIGMRYNPPADREPVRFVFNIDSGLTLVDAPGTLVISPDGRQIAFVATQDDGVRHLFIRSSGELRSRMIPGAESAEQLFFSPNGEWIGFYVRPHLMRVRADHGDPILIGDVPGMFGAHWVDDEDIVLSSGGRLALISAVDGKLNAIAKPDTAAGELQQLWPLVLADGKTIVYTARGRYVEESRLAVTTVGGDSCRILDLAGTGALGMVDGELIYGVASGIGPERLFAVPFDEDKARVRGAPRSVLSGVRVNFWGRAAASVSRSGSLVYQFTEELSRQIVVAQRNGQRQTLPGGPRAFHDPRFSPDGKQLAVSADHDGLYVFDLTSATFNRLTPSVTWRVRYPEWTPDGRGLIYLRCATERAPCEVWTVPASIGGRESFFAKSDQAQVEMAETVLSTDGKILVTRVNVQANGERDIWYRRRGADTTLKPLIVLPGHQFGPRISPDGRWLAFYTNSAPGQVLVSRLDRADEIHKVSIDAGENPVWSPDGKQLYYVERKKGSRVVAATLRMSPGFTVVSRDTIFEGGFDSRPEMHSVFDVAPDGRRFALLERVDREPQIIVVHDWAAEMRQSRSVARR